jgi:hypothetical protein
VLAANNSGLRPVAKAGAEVVFCSSEYEPGTQADIVKGSKMESISPD